MSTLKPHLIRADTLDLQSADSPSAQDHSRHPAYNSPVGTGPAPHQNQSLRNAEHDAMQEQMQSPRLRQTHGQPGYADEPNFYDDQDDDVHDEAHHQGDRNGMPADDSGVDDSDIGDQGDDDGLDDDLMDKISSSPSIDDGKYPFSISRSPAMNPMTPMEAHGLRRPPRSVSDTEDYPIHFPRRTQGKYGRGTDLKGRKANLPITQNFNQADLAKFQESEAESDDFESDLSLIDLAPYLVPLNDARLENDQFADDDQQVNIAVRRADDDWESISESESSHSDHGFYIPSERNFIDSDLEEDCLQDLEDIDFEFVYALHTFVATVEGQANATKGDTMVLLDDSNSYWWLVRVVKDGSIGYLPAEHIETPTERLARLNKHRNIDLSATMLGDNPEKSKNPLKKAMRRRNAKTVQFGVPQYFEPPEYGFSDDDDLDPDDEGMEGDDIANHEDGDVSAGSDPQADPATNVTRVRTGSVTSDNGVQVHEGVQSTEKSLQSPDHVLASTESPHDEYRDSNGQITKGPRNTDSFYKDDTAETKKISLTPRLLRGDSDITGTAQTADLKAKSSVETFDKIVSPESEKFGEEKKKKEKKGMLGGLFKRKDKKGKNAEVETEDNQKTSEELSRKKSVESIQKAPQRQSSKLQKQPPPHVAAKTSPSRDNLLKSESSPHLSMDSTLMSPQDSVSASTPSTLRSPAPETRGFETVSPRSMSPDAATERPTSPRTAPILAASPRAVSPTGNQQVFAPLTGALQPAGQTVADHDRSGDATPTPGNKARNGSVGDGYDAASPQSAMKPTLAAAAPRHSPPRLVTTAAEPARDRLSESPVEVSPIEPGQSQQSSLSQPPALLVDTSSASERRSVSPISPTASSGSLVEVDAQTPNDAYADVDASTNPSATSPTADAPTPSTARSTPTWSDASLRTYMDNDDDIRDLLIIVHDKSNVTPAGPDHPITGNLFSTEKGRLNEMQTNLDSLLSGWLARKNQALRLSRS